MFPNIRNQKIFLHVLTRVFTHHNSTHTYPKRSVCVSVKAAEAAGQIHDRFINLSSAPLFSRTRHHFEYVCAHKTHIWTQTHTHTKLAVNFLRG